MVNRAGDFLALHRPGSPLLLPNAWDLGSAKILAHLGFAALATTSSGFAATLGRLDGRVPREEVLAHAAAVVAAVDIAVSADLENGYGHRPEDVASTAEAAVATGLAGFSIEDWSGESIYPSDLAAARVEAAVEAAAGRAVVTARAENFLHGVSDLGDTVARLQRYALAGADVLYAPGIVRPTDIAAVVGALDKPVNVLLLERGPSCAELAELGVSRISLGGSLAYAALGTIVAAAGELLAGSPPGFWALAANGRKAAQEAFD